MNDHEAAGLKLAPEKSKNLPNRILRAFNNAKHLGGLKRTTRDVLAELCRLVPQNRAFEPVFVHKKTLAALIGMSERTLYRHLLILVEEKLVEILEQERRSRSGRFAVSRIRLTRKAAILLGFIEAPEELALIEPNDAVRADPESDTSANPSAAVKPAGNYSAQQVIHTVKFS